jgi:H+/Cl- antiporter ClcA
MAPMQKRAWWGLSIGLLFGIAFIIIFFTMGGIEKFDENQNFRIIIDILAIGALVVNLIIVNVPLRKRGMADERDLKIIDWAPRVQWLAVIFALVAWTVGLTEYYHKAGQVPSVYLFIIFMSVLVVSTLAQSLGIIIGYWRMNR